MNATSMKAFLVGLAMASGLSGCATESTTVRTMSEPQQADQTPAATYPVPKTDPKGTAYVMSLGRESLAAPAGAAPAGTQAVYLHLRLAVENTSDAAAWTLDAHDQTVNLGAGPAQPTYAQGSTGNSVVSVAPGQHGYLDLYYALPAGNPAQAILSWQVRRASDVVSDSTPFALQAAQTPEYAYYQPVGVAVEYRPAWWWGVGFYGPWWWGPGWGPYPYWGYYGGYGYRGPHYNGGFHGGYGPGPGFRGGPGPGFHGGGGPGFRPGPGGGGHYAPPPAPRGFGGGGRGGRPGFHH